MKKIVALLSCVAALLYTAVAGAQLYKSVGADGRVSYSDTPPASAAQIEKKIPNQGSRDELPADLAAAAGKNPVTLYTTGKCQPCDEGRDLLRQRGIPFAEKTVHTNDDLAVLRQAGGDQHLPLLSIGGHKQQGFDADGWHAALSAGGYPTIGKLPKTYQNPAAVAAAGEPPKLETKVVPATARAARQPAVSTPPTAPVADPSGFRF